MELLDSEEDEGDKGDYSDNVKLFIPEEQLYTFFIVNFMKLCLVPGCLKIASIRSYLSLIAIKYSILFSKLEHM